MLKTHNVFLESEPKGYGRSESPEFDGGQETEPVGNDSSDSGETVELEIRNTSPARVL